MSSLKNNQPILPCGSSRSKKSGLQLLTCGSCSGLTRDKLIAENKTTCLNVGKLSSSKACSSHRPDVFSLDLLNSRQTDSTDTLNLLATSISELSISELQIVAALFLSEKKTRKEGYHFWQKVYVRVRGRAGDHYLNNFVVGRILDANKEYIRVISETGKTCIQVVNEKDTHSLYTMERFEGLRSEMLRLGNFTDPTTEMRLKRTASPALESIDFAVEAGLITEEFSKSNKKVRKSSTSDLVTIVKRMASGKLARRKNSYAFDSDINIHHI